MTLTPLQLELTRLIGKKELSFGCWIRNTKSRKCFEYHWIEWLQYNEIAWPDLIRNAKHLKIIGHPASETDFKKWMNDNLKMHHWEQLVDWIFIVNEKWIINRIPYDSSKELLDQSEDTLKQIRDLILSNF